MSRLFSGQGLWTLGKTLLKMAVLAAVGYLILHGLMHAVLGDSTLPLPVTLAAATSTVVDLMRFIGVLALVIAGADYFFQRRTYQQNLRMTKQEVKDERRQSDGSPEVRRALRSKARRFTRMHIMAAVANADVVVTNPTHYAVAIAYDRKNDRAPRVVAKGAGYIAAGIKSARANVRRGDRGEPTPGPLAARVVRGGRRRPAPALRRGGPPPGLRLLALPDGAGLSGRPHDGQLTTRANFAAPALNSHRRRGRSEYGPGRPWDVQGRMRTEEIARGGSHAARRVPVSQVPSAPRAQADRWAQLTHMAVPLSVVAVVVVLVIPLPTFLIDLLITANITGSVLVLLTAMQVKRPLDFSVFPTLVLVATMFRLALNVAVTRQVLLHGYAGVVVSSFGHFVIGGSIVVGLVVFLILIIIQFVVITVGIGPGRRGGGPLHPRRHARKADGHRRRPRLGRHRRARGAPPPQGDRRRGRLLRRHGRSVQVRPG